MGNKIEKILSDFQVRGLFNEIKKEGFKKPILLNNASIQKRIITEFVSTGIVFFRQSYGAGVIVLFPVDDVCPHCKGKGSV
jgi:hypothetical protein